MNVWKRMASLVAAGLLAAVGGAQAAGYRMPITFAGYAHRSEALADVNSYTFALRGAGDSGAAIGVLGVNGQNLASGSGASTAAGTDYGASAAGLPVDHTFTITNTGVQSLTFDPITLSGSSAFSLVAPFPSSPVPAGGATTFGIRFGAAAAGTFTGAVSIANNTLTSTPFTFALQGVAKTTWYVAPGGDDASNGTSWAAAKASITGGIAVASAGQVVLVSNGVYTLAAEIALNKALTVQGYSGNPADVAVDGAGAYRCFNVTVASATIQDLTIANGLAAGGNGGGVLAPVTLFTLRNCIIAGNRANHGGGLFVDVYQPVVTGCVFRANQATAGSGGGCYGRGTIRNSTFIANTATGSGGGAWSFAGSYYDSSFLTNSAASGGGAWENSGSVIAVTGCVFQANQATAGIGGGMYSLFGTYQNSTFIANTASGDGGGGELLYCTFQNNTFIANVASGNGGAVRTAGSTFSGCTFLTNSAAAGGGIYTDNGNANTVTGCVFRANQATTGNGGGVNLYLCLLQNSDFSANTAAGNGGGASMTAANSMFSCTFSNNTASGSGGAISVGAYTLYNSLFVGNEAMSEGGAISVNNSGTAQTLENCTLTENTAVGNGGGLRAYAATIRNSILWGNAGAATYSNLYVSGALDATYTCAGPKPLGAGNLATNPLFTATGSGVGAADAPGTYTLQGASLCRNSGQNQGWMTTTYTNDLAGNARILENTVDMGAYEYALLPIIGVLGTNGGAITNAEAASVAKGTDYGTVNAGSPVAHTFAITNSGSGTLTLTGNPRIAISGAGATAYTTNGTAAATSIAPGESTTCTVQFDPSLSQTYAATVSIANDSSVTPFTFALTGEGVSTLANIDVLGTNGAAIAIGEAAALDKGTDFGPVLLGNAADHVFSVSNRTGVALALTGTPAVAISGDTADFFTNGTAVATSITAGSSTFQVHFVPQASGLRTALVSIANDVLGKDPYTFALRGWGDNGADMDVLGTNQAVLALGEAASVDKGTDFGTANVGDGVERAFTVTNGSVAALLLSGTPTIAFSGDSADFFTNGMAVATSLTAGSSTFRIRFSPQASGVRAALVSIANSVYDKNPYTFAVRGAGNNNGNWYVAPPPVGNDVAHGGTGWADAEATIQAAINDASAGHTVWVAAGVYTQSVEIALNKAVTVRGASGNAADVVVDGSGAVRCFNVTPQYATIQDLTITNGLSAGNGGGVLVNQLYFTLQNCILAGNQAGIGGGLYDYPWSSTVTGCVFRANQATSGGGYMGNGKIRNSAFVANTASGNGGGVFSHGAAFYNTSFLTNAAAQGGGAWENSGNVITVTGCVFQANQATAGIGGGMYSLYGTFRNNTFIANTASTDGGGGNLIASTLQDNIFIANVASGNGGGVRSGYSSLYGCSFLTNSAAAGGGIYADSGNAQTVTGCVFRANQATSGSGGGGYFYTCLLLNSDFAANIASVNGGAVAMVGTANSMYRCAFFNNTASGSGGAISVGAYTLYNSLFVGNEASAQGGGLYGGSGVQTLENCTLTENSAGGNGGGLGAASATIRNSILWGNTGASTYSNLYVSGALDATYTCADPLPAGAGNIATNPLFTAVGSGFGAADVPGTYTLRWSSPACNAGSNQDWMEGATDLAGNVRIYQRIVDMGAYENVANPQGALILIF